MTQALGAFLLPLLAVIGGTRLALAWLARKAILDHPNERSSHSRPTPRGGGLAVTPVVLVTWATICAGGTPVAGLGPVLAGGAVLFALSWMDDKSGLSARLRLGVHVLAVGAGLLAFPADHLVCQGWLPLWADRLVALVAWVWFVNLFNFMDGIDGITGVETGSLGLGLALLAALAADGPGQWLALSAAAAGIGFLVWNWHPAKIFLGDSGSIPLGFLLGWLLLRTAADGHWAPALILPAYYLTDATLTLARRARRGETIFQAHRQHFYQQAVQGGIRHSDVAVIILLANLGLIALALTALTHPLTALAAAAADVALLLVLLAALGRRRR
jgi:UDP-N-acetylmuramyl pentapeptide phosphotransferase/UDP-N-acetylglucosamine-1-phosphate transferase